MTFPRLELLLCAALLSAAPGVSAAQRLPISFGAPRVVEPGAAVSSIMAARVGPDGSVYVADDAGSRVVAFDADGRRRWSLGRRGRGPGEFHRPYRLDVRRDGTVFVYDAGTGEVTTITSEGRFVQRYRLPFPLTQVDALIALDDALLISGTTTDPVAGSRAIHRFRMRGPELRHDRSFGTLPTARDPLVQQMWGAGSIIPGSAGSVWYTRRLPYEVYRLDAAGRQRGLVRPPFRTRGTPDDVIRIDRGTRTAIESDTAAVVEIPGPAWELPGGVLLVSRIRPGARFWDVFSVAGRYQGAHRLPGEWDGIAGYDPSRRVLWVTGTRNDEPVLYRVPVVLTPSPTRRP